jgi:hypothetical protein
MMMMMIIIIIIIIISDNIWDRRIYIDFAEEKFYSLVGAKCAKAISYENCESFTIIY